MKEIQQLMLEYEYNCYIAIYIDVPFNCSSSMFKGALHLFGQITHFTPPLEVSLEDQ